MRSAMLPPSSGIYGRRRLSLSSGAGRAYDLSVAPDPAATAAISRSCSNGLEFLLCPDVRTWHRRGHPPGASPGVSPAHLPDAALIVSPAPALTVRELVM